MAIDGLIMAKDCNYKIVSQSASGQTLKSDGERHLEFPPPWLPVIDFISNRMLIVQCYDIWCQGIREGSLISKIEGIYVGDHIEKINDESMVGRRHYEVAKTLKEIPRGETFSLRLIEPMKSGFSKSLQIFHKTPVCVLVWIKFRFQLKLLLDNRLRF